jgi:hypothetical protein
MAVTITFSPPAWSAENPAMPVLQPTKILIPVVDWAAASSPTLRRMLDAVSTLEGSHLTILQRLQPNSSMRAHSTFLIRRDGGFRVDGSVFLPPAQSRSEIAALLAHELAHALALAGIVDRDSGDPSDENLARSFEDAVRSELRGGRSTAFAGRSPFSRPPAGLHGSS